MLFNSYQFMLFFPLVTIIFFVLPPKAKCPWLLLASYYFYMVWNKKYLLLMILVTSISYLCGLWLMKSKHKKLILALSISSNIVLLLLFKYINFMFDTINRLAKYVGGKEIFDPLNIILPAGISFYIFQVISYLIDVYRQKISAEKNVFRYALFVAFYPQLLQGPIERADNLINSFKKIEDVTITFNFERVRNGLILVLYGFFMKIVIADRLSPFVQSVFAETDGLPGFILFFGALAFTLQIYCDFGGYSIIALGISQLYGIALTENFKAPYFATSITDFWRRWHISLSSWFRDYLYFPLGGSRCSLIKTARNIMIVFLISGLWHGAAWKFIVWGGIHGIFQVIERIMKRNETTKITSSLIKFISKMLKIAITDIIVTLAWIFFNADSLRNALKFIKNMIIGFINPRLNTITDYSQFGINRIDFLILTVSLLIVLFVDIIREIKDIRLDIFLSRTPIFFRWSFCIIMFCMVLVFGIYGPGSVETGFLYFQF